MRAPATIAPFCEINRDERGRVFQVEPLRFFAVLPPTANRRQAMLVERPAR